MKLSYFFVLGGCLLATGISAHSNSGNESPVAVEIFEMEEDGDDGYQSNRQGGWGNRGMGIGHAYLTSQICQAIQNQSRIQIVLKNKEVVNSKELKITAKLLTVEPYAFGMTGDGLPILKGNIVEQKDLKIVTVKVFEDRFNEKNFPAPVAASHKGWFRSDTGVQLVDLRGVKGLRLVPNTHFDAPKDFKGFQDDKDLQVQAICSLPIKAPQKP